MCLTKFSNAYATAPLCSLNASTDACQHVSISVSKEGQLCLYRWRISGTPHPTRFSSLVSVCSQTPLPFCLPSQLLLFLPASRTWLWNCQVIPEEGWCIPTKYAEGCKVPPSILHSHFSIATKSVSDKIPRYVAWWRGKPQTWLKQNHDLVLSVFELSIFLLMVEKFL